MKKVGFILTIVAAMFSTKSFAQTAQANLNVKLHPIQTIVIGGENTVNLEYKTKDDYLNGVTSKMNELLNRISKNPSMTKEQAADYMTQYNILKTMSGQK